MKLSKKLHQPDANYWLKTGTADWRVDYVGGTNIETAEKLKVDADLSLEPVTFVISGASDHQV